jgi:superkiller protein 3
MNNPAKFLGDSFGTTLLIFMLMLTSNRSSTRNQFASPEELFRQAQKACHENDYTRAEKLYRQVLAVDPGVLAARVDLGLACYWQGKSREAIAELQRALRVSPREFSALLFSGLAYINLGEYDRAQQALDEAARIKSTDPLLFWALGSLAMIHNDANTAVPLLERCATLDPNNVRCVWLLGQAYAHLAYRQKPKAPADYAARVEEALRWMEKRQPDSALLHVFKGDVLAARKLTAEALTEYRKALEIDPRWPDINLLMGSLLGLLGRWDEALSELKLQLRNHPEDTRALVEMGSVYCRSGNYDAAVPILKQALARDHNNYEASYRLGQSYVTLGQHEMAVPLLERATKLNPEKSDPYYLLYRSYRALKQPEKATAALEQFKHLKSLGS